MDGGARQFRREYLIDIREDAELLRVNQRRVMQAQLLMHESGARGVPAVIAEACGKRRVVNMAGMYTDTD